VPFFVIKSALFVQANGAVNTKFLKGAPFVRKSPSFKKKIGQKRAISIW
jgi:hypothetical protein